MKGGRRGGGGGGRGGSAQLSFGCGPLPPFLTSTSHSPDVILVIGGPRPSPFFATLLLMYIILKNKE